LRDGRWSRNPSLAEVSIRLYFALLYPMLTKAGVRFHVRPKHTRDADGRLESAALVLETVARPGVMPGIVVLLTLHTGSKQGLIESWRSTLRKSKIVDLNVTRPAPWLHPTQLQLYDSDAFFAKLAAHTSTDFNALMCHYWMVTKTAGADARCESCSLQLECLARST
jgi:hypothetical protein